MGLAEVQTQREEKSGLDRTDKNRLIHNIQFRIRDITRIRQ